MLGVDVDSRRVVLDRALHVFLLTKCESSVMVEICLIRLQLDRQREVLNCLIIRALPVQRYPFVIVGEGISPIQLDRRRVVSNSQVEFAQLVVSEAPVKERLEMLGVDIKRPRVVVYRPSELPLLPRRIPLRVELLRSLFQLLCVASKHHAALVLLHYYMTASRLH